MAQAVAALSIGPRALSNTPGPLSFYDLEIMARTLYGEVRGEPWAGKIAVAWVIRNRAEADLGRDNRPDWWGEGIAGVCLKPMQFSCWNAARDRKRLETAVSLKLADCLRAAFAVLTDEEPDPTSSATHYYANYIAEPKWAHGKQPTAVIGVHRFYKLA